MFKKKILVVDDSDFFLRAIDSTLSQDSYEVILASSGEEGLRLVREEKRTLSCWTSSCRM